MRGEEHSVRCGLDVTMSTTETGEVDVIRPQWVVSDGTNPIAITLPNVQHLLVFELESSLMEKPSFGCFSPNNGKASAVNQLAQLIMTAVQNPLSAEAEAATSAEAAEKKDAEGANPYAFYNGIAHIHIYMEKLRKPDGYWASSRFFVCIMNAHIDFAKKIANTITSNAQWWRKASEKAKTLFNSDHLEQHEMFRLVNSNYRWACLVDAYFGEEYLTRSGSLAQFQTPQTKLWYAQNIANPMRLFTLSRDFNIATRLGVRSTQTTPSNYCSTATSNAHPIDHDWNGQITFPHPEDVYEVGSNLFNPRKMTNLLLPGAASEYSRRLGLTMTRIGENGQPLSDDSIPESGAMSLYAISDGNSDPDTFGARQSSLSDKLMRFANAEDMQRRDTSFNVDRDVKQRDPMYKMSEENEAVIQALKDRYDPDSDEFAKAMHAAKSEAIEQFSKYFFSEEDLTHRTRGMQSMAHYVKNVLQTKKHFFIPPSKMVKNLSLFANMMARKFVQLDRVCKLWTAHTLLCTLFYGTMDHSRFGRDLHFNAILAGPNQTSKTYTLENCLQGILLVPNTADLVSHSTTHSRNVDVSLNDVVKLVSEMSLQDLGMDQYGHPISVNQQFKDRLTTCRTLTETIHVNKKTGKREYRVSTCDCMGCEIHCTNDPLTNTSVDLLSRFLVVQVYMSQRTDIDQSHIDIAAGDKEHYDTNIMSTDRDEWNNEHALIYLVNKLIRLNIIPDVDMREAQRELRKIKAEVRKRLNVSWHKRDEERILIICRSLTIAYTIEIAFRSEFSWPLLEKMKAEKRGFEMKDLLVLQPLLICPSEILFFVVTLLENTLLPLPHLDFMKKSIAFFQNGGPKTTTNKDPDCRYRQYADEQKCHCTDYRYLVIEQSEQSFARAMYHQMEMPKPSQRTILSMLNDLKNMMVDAYVRDVDGNLVAKLDPDTSRPLTRVKRDSAGKVVTGPDGRPLREPVYEKEKIPAVLYEENQFTNNSYAISVAVEYVLQSYGNVMAEILQETRDAFFTPTTIITGVPYTHKYKTRVSRRGAEGREDGGENSSGANEEEKEALFPYLMRTLHLTPNMSRLDCTRHVYQTDRLVLASAPPAHWPDEAYEGAAAQSIDEPKFHISDGDPLLQYALMRAVTEGLDVDDPFTTLISPNEQKRVLEAGAYDYEVLYKYAFEKYPEDVAEYKIRQNKKVEKEMARAKAQMKRRANIGGKGEITIPHGYSAFMKGTLNPARTRPNSRTRRLLDRVGMASLRTSSTSTARSRSSEKGDRSSRSHANKRPIPALLKPTEVVKRIRTNGSGRIGSKDGHSSIRNLPSGPGSSSSAVGLASSSDSVIVPLSFNALPRLVPTGMDIREGDDGSVFINMIPMENNSDTMDSEEFSRTMRSRLGSTSSSSSPSPKPTGSDMDQEQHGENDEDEGDSSAGDLWSNPFDA